MPVKSVEQTESADFSATAESNPRKQAEKSLRDNEPRFSIFFHTSPLPIAISRLSDQRLVDVNEAWETVTGFSREESIRHTPTELHIWVDPDARERLVNELREKNRVNNLHFQVRQKSGAISDMLLSAERIELAGESCMLTMAQDITEMKRAEEALKQEKEFSESMFLTAPMIIMLLDTNGCIVNFNPCMEKISGYKIEEVKGKDWFDTFLSKVDGPRIKDLFKQTIDDVQTEGSVNPIITKDGREVIVEWYDQTLKDRDGQIAGLVSIGQNITKRKQAEDRTRQQLEELRRWHDASIGREERIVELKREVNALVARLGEQPPYKSVDGSLAEENSLR